MIDSKQLVNGECFEDRFECRAQMYIKNGAVYIVYTHEDETCSVKAAGGHVVILRHKSGSRIELECGREYASQYSGLELRAAASAVDNRLCTDNILTLRYRLSVGGTESKNTVIIKTEEI